MPSSAHGSEPAASIEDAADDLFHGVTTSALLVHALGRFPESPAITLGERTLTRADLAAEISRCQQALERHGLGDGTPFALLSRSRIDALVAQFAAQLGGGRMTLLSAMSSVDDLAFILDDAGIEALIIDEDAFPGVGDELGARCASVRTIFRLVQAREPASPPAPEDDVRPVVVDLLAAARAHTPRPLSAPRPPGERISSIAYTGGTTGAPKGVQGTYRSAAALTQIQLTDWEWPERPCTLVCTPLSHAGGSLVLPTLLRGGRVVVLPSFTPDRFLDAVEEHDVDTVMLVPTMLYALLEAPGLDHRDLRSLRTVFYGAAPIRAGFLEHAVDRLGPIFFQFYGQTECGMTISVLRKEDHLRPELLSSCGRAVPWLDVRILDANGEEAAVGEVGEVCVRGPLVMRGYWNRPEETATALQGGWLHTGDLARVDAEGYLTIVDRRKDMIVTGGFNVYSAEVEQVLASHPGVREAVVVGLPDPRWGEAVTALVVTEGEGTDHDELRALVRRRKGPVHVPKRVIEVSALPRTALGKIDKAAARDHARRVVLGSEQRGEG